MKIKQVTVGIIGTKGERQTAVYDADLGKIVIGSIDTIVAAIDSVARVGEVAHLALVPATDLMPPVLPSEKPAALKLPTELANAKTEGDIRDVVTSAVKAAEPKAAAPAEKKVASSKPASAKKKAAAKKSASRKKSAKKDK